MLFLIQIVLLVLWFTVCPTLPWFVVFLPILLPFIIVFLTLIGIFGLLAFFWAADHLK